jgi:hypothetical protein
LQAKGHPIIEFVLSDEDVLLAHRHVEGMNFIPGGYSYPEWDVANPSDENQMTGGTGEFAISSNPHVTRSNAGREGTGPSSMSVDLRMAPQTEVVQRVSPVGEPQLTPVVGVGGLPSGDLEGQTPMEHDGQETNSIYSLSPTSQQSPSPTLMGAPSSFKQIPVNSNLSNETPTVVMEGLIQMEALTLQQSTDTSDVAPEHAPVHAEAPSASTLPRGTRSKKSTPRAASTGHGSREKAEGSKRRKNRVSPVRATEDTEIPHPTAADNP